MKNELLPIGSVVEVEKQNLMICSYVKKGKELNGKKYDYACCLFPFGMGANAILINKEQIKRVVFVGLQNNDFLKLKKMMENLK